MDNKNLSAENFKLRLENKELLEKYHRQRNGCKKS